MESFLKYLRGGAAAAGNQRTPVVATTIAASACEDGGGGGDVVDDDASFFDLEFAVPGDEGFASDDAEEERVEFNFAVASGAEVVAVEEDAVAGDGKKGGEEEEEKKEDDAEVDPPPPAASLLRPASTKFRVLMLKLRKPNNKVAVPSADGNGGGGAPPAAKTTTTRRFLIKFRVDGDAPLVSLFTRDNSSRASDAAVAAADNDRPTTAVQDAISAEEQRRFAREVLARYLNKIKPLYVKVSRLRFPGGGAGGAGEGEETDAEEPDASPASSQSHPQPVVVACGVRAPRASVPAGLKQVCKRLGKSRSASSAVAAAPSPPPPPPPPAAAVVVPQRRDDSLLQLQDGIQSAIAHCKRSFNASKGCESPLLRSMTVGGDAIARDGRVADTSDGGA